MPTILQPSFTLNTTPECFANWVKRTTFRSYGEEIPTANGDILIGTCIDNGQEASAGSPAQVWNLPAP
jgi:hypothetical protein